MPVVGPVAVAGVPLSSGWTKSSTLEESAQWLIESYPAAPPVPLVCYRFGDGLLELRSDHPGLLDQLWRLYKDCALAPHQAGDQVRVRCTVRTSADEQVALLSFTQGAPSGGIAIALSLLHPPFGTVPYAVADSRFRGWQVIRGGHTPERPVLAVCGEHVAVSLQDVAPEVIAELLVSATLAAQHHILPVHGASLRIGEAGLLLVGPSHAGKTTTTLNLAARGHALLGDEIALIQLATGRLLPFPRTMNLRPGPRVQALTAALARSAVPRTDEPGWSGSVGISDLFPGAPDCSPPLRAAFFLSGFTERASLARFHLTLDDANIFTYLSENEVTHASWGLVSERRALRLLALHRLLARIPCWQLRVGPPAETAEVIEHTMEGL